MIQRSVLRTMMSSAAGQRSFVAALIASALILPLLLFPLFEPSYRGMYVSAASDEEHYVSIIREVSEGRVLHQNTYLLEEKNAPVNILQWGDVPAGLLFRLWPWGVGAFVLVLKWVGVFFTSWLLLLFLERAVPSLTRGWRVAATTGFFVLPAFLGPAIVPRMWEAVQGQGPWREFLGTIRLTNPVLTAVVWVGSFVTLERLFREARWSHAFRHGVVLGLLAWLYVYFWMFAMVATGLAALWRLGTRGWQEGRWYVLALLVSGLIAAPYWGIVAHSMAQAAYQVSIDVPSHAFILEWSVIASVGIFALWLMTRRFFKKQYLSSGETLLLLLGMTAIVAVNHQVLTGKSIQPHHFYFYTDMPVAGLLLLLAAGMIATTILPRRVAAGIGIAAAAVMLWLGVGVQTATLQNVWTEYADRQRLAPAMEVIKTRGTPFVVLSNGRASELVPMYTGADVFYAPHATAYLSTGLERRIFAWNLQAYLNGVRSVEEARNVFTAQREQIGLVVFEAQHYREACGSYACFPDVFLEDLIQGYGSFLALDPEAMFRRYRIDAVLWDERQDPLWHLERYSFLRRTWSGDGVSLWDVMPISVN